MRMSDLVVLIPHVRFAAWLWAEALLVRAGLYDVIGKSMTNRI